MTGPAPDVVVAASRLRAALEDTAAALAGADLERLLASDALLRKILGEMPPPGPGRPDPALQRDIEDAQAALRRCRRLGESLGSFVRLSLDAHGGLGYEPGRAPVASMTGRTFSERA